MNAGQHTTNDPHDAWLERIEQQLREQDEALEQAWQVLAASGPMTVGIAEEALEELREACVVRRAVELAPAFATRC